ncbi:non-functional NADPH-dependent codeinone reductase 2 [Ricinus communis]|uniref:Aldo-keto reductase, putative n=1 Tax=Ricinus communis TaxID=3988 RepID=B9S2J1_RICCO|nr:non-functional NADPH-dependent codeinone reductase 2 [Ricinus communis]EEF42265.1 aldo-keto reductase, putative [Ricinus communis]|eukprot:XP_002520210.1 non-functional NADPH-dependent codeinone reductase 2 [Ricinus communis]
MESELLINIPEVLLTCSGRRMPLLGMGTSTSPLVGSDEIKAAILQAIELGYRHFDTATLYLTEEPLGQAIEEAISRGLVKSREELFITSKLWCSDAHSDLVLPALQKSLHALQLEYIDLYLIHWPMSSRPGIYEFPIKKEDLLPMDFKGVWAAMEECKKLGLTKSIGVCNFSCKKLSDILAIAEIPPAINQVEINPIWQQKKQMEFCKANGIILTAYAPLGGSFNRVMENEVLKEIANAKGKSVAQICLRWAYEQGVCVLVKSFNRERMKENLDIFNWTLTEEESKRITEIPQRRGSSGEDYISDTGPFKTLEELWDGEI